MVTRWTHELFEFSKGADWLDGLHDDIGGVTREFVVVD